MYGFDRKGFPCPLMFEQRAECRFIADKRMLGFFFAILRRVHSPAYAAFPATLSGRAARAVRHRFGLSDIASFAQRAGKSQLIQFRQKIVGDACHEHAALLARG